MLHFPTVLGAVVPTYNIEGVTQELNFTGEVLADIFMGKITKWNDPALAGINQGVNLPDTDIVVVHRSDGSGTSLCLDGLPFESQQRVGVESGSRYFGKLAGGFGRQRQ